MSREFYVSTEDALGAMWGVYEDRHGLTVPLKFFWKQSVAWEECKKRAKRAKGWARLYKKNGIVRTAHCYK